MSRNKNFKKWLVDALADLDRMQEELDNANRDLQDAVETQRKCYQQRPGFLCDKQLRGRIKYAERCYHVETERERLRLLVDKCGACVRLQRERIVQAWQRHADRAAKRYAQATDTERHRVMREIAGLYAVFCMVDNFSIVGGDVYTCISDLFSRRRQAGEKHHDITERIDSRTA